MDAAARAFFYPSLFYNVTLEKLNIRDWYNQIEPKIILGALPFKSTLNEVVQNLKVTHFLTLNEDHELKSFYPKPEDFAKLNCQVKRVKVTDFVGAPPIEDIEKAVDFIDSVVKQEDGVVYKVVVLKCQIQGSGLSVRMTILVETVVRAISSVCR